MQLKNHVVLGIYSDPSSLAIELAFIETDGLDISKVYQTRICPYPHELRDQLLIYTAQKQENPELFNTLNHDVIWPKDQLQGIDDDPADAHCQQPGARSAGRLSLNQHLFNNHAQQISKKKHCSNDDWNAQIRIDMQ